MLKLDSNVSTETIELEVKWLQGERRKLVRAIDELDTTIIGLKEELRKRKEIPPPLDEDI